MKEKIEELSPLALAFLGDSLHTSFVRLYVLNGQKEKLNTYHLRAKKFCNANSQATALDFLQDELHETEQKIVKKARNAHNKHSSKNFDEETYKKATAFEALIGFLYLNRKEKRLEEILEKSIKIIEQTQNN